MLASQLRPGARFVAGDAISAGDVVYFSELPGDTLVARTVTREILASIQGSLYVAIADGGPEELTFREVSRTDLNEP